jgi:hypothetical protein
VGLVVEVRVIPWCDLLVLGERFGMRWIWPWQYELQEWSITLMTLISDSFLLVRGESWAEV